MFQDPFPSRYLLTSNWQCTRSTSFLLSKGPLAKPHSWSRMLCPLMRMMNPRAATPWGFQSSLQPWASATAMVHKCHEPLVRVSLLSQGPGTLCFVSFHLRSFPSSYLACCVMLPACFASLSEAILAQGLMGSHFGVPGLPESIIRSCHRRRGYSRARDV